MDALKKSIPASYSFLTTKLEVCDIHTTELEIRFSPLVGSLWRLPEPGESSYPSLRVSSWLPLTYKSLLLSLATCNYNLHLPVLSLLSCSNHLSPARWVTPSPNFSHQPQHSLVAGCPTWVTTTLSGVARGEPFRPNAQMRLVIIGFGVIGLGMCRNGNGI